MHAFKDTILPRTCFLVHVSARCPRPSPGVPSLFFLYNLPLPLPHFFPFLKQTSEFLPDSLSYFSSLQQLKPPTLFIIHFYSLIGYWNSIFFPILISSSFFCFDFVFFLSVSVFFFSLLCVREFRELKWGFCSNFGDGDRESHEFYVHGEKL